MIKYLNFPIQVDTARRINLNRELNPRITEYNKDATNKINPLTGQSYLKNFRGVQSSRIRIGMGQIGRIWDEGEIFPTLSDYLHLQTVLGTMDNADNDLKVRESFENLVKNIEKLQIGIDSINNNQSLETALNNLNEITTLEVQGSINQAQKNYLNKNSSFFPYLLQ